jgi:hypothetical protein
MAPSIAVASPIAVADGALAIPSIWRANTLGPLFKAPQLVLRIEYPFCGNTIGFGRGHQFCVFFVDDIMQLT